VLLGVLLTSCLAAYAFARIEMKGREGIFILFLSMMMIPQPVYLVPSFLILARLHWIDTYYALIIPWMASVFSIFLLRQHFRTVPNDLYDAAIIDGCNRFWFLWRIIIPLSKATLITVSLFSVIGSWNSFMWPLVMVNDDKLRPIQIGLARFAQEQGSEHSLMMAAATFCIIPLLLVYFFAQRQIMSSFAQSGLKE
jgi:ABC-type glycerol-3-phosphate transport system permease component